MRLSVRHPTGLEQLLVEFAHYARIRPHVLARDIGRGNSCEDVTDDVESRLVLVVGAYHDPGRCRGVGAREHPIARLAVVAPVPLGGLVHRAELPLLERIAAPLAQPSRLLAAADVEVVLEQVHARTTSMRS